MTKSQIEGSGGSGRTRISLIVSAWLGLVSFSGLDTDELNERWMDGICECSNENGHYEKSVRLFFCFEGDSFFFRQVAFLSLPLVLSFLHGPAKSPFIGLAGFISMGGCLHRSLASEMSMRDQRWLTSFQPSPSVILFTVQRALPAASILFTNSLSNPKEKTEYHVHHSSSPSPTP